MPPDTPAPPTPAEAQSLRTGVFYALAAFLWWGLSPLYWKAVGAVPAVELIAWRVIASLLLLAALLAVARRGRELARVLRSPRTLATLAATTLLIVTNWLTFIWAMGAERVLETSLGYYVNPLVNVVLGMLFLGERLRRAQGLAVAFATVGVAILTWEVGRLPWVALVLAVTFGFYALLRKTVAAGPEVGLAIETALLTPFMIGWLVWLGASGGAAFPEVGRGVQALVLTAGLITVAPLVWFTHGARRLPLATIGLLQYIAPTGQFLLAIFLFGEPFNAYQLVAFALIWCGLGVFTWDLRRRMGAARTS